MFKLDVGEMPGLLLSLAFALLFGTVTAIVYAFKNRYSRHMIVALVVLPIVICAVLTLVNGNVGGVGIGIAIAGAFGLLRFRSAPGTAMDITYVFIALASGVTAATGEVGYGAIAVGGSLAVIAVFKFIPLKKGNSSFRSLRLTVPESLNYTEAFDEVLHKYSSSYELIKAKTTNMGSTFELTFELTLKAGANEKEFIDEIRVRNGNLPVSCSTLSAKEENL